MSKFRADSVLHSFPYKVCLLPSALPGNVPLDFQKELQLSWLCHRSSGLGLLYNCVKIFSGLNHHTWLSGTKSQLFHKRIGFLLLLLLNLSRFFQFKLTTLTTFSAHAIEVSKQPKSGSRPKLSGFQPSTKAESRCWVVLAVTCTAQAIRVPDLSSANKDCLLRVAGLGKSLL